ncbi:hypothetical protein AB0G15_05885 [Streptosporangium sp. NPDC023825]|uniref:hypothetical protein n=1 Tax=Streptosporangium sp. NPDC023825 TaxID=3154909 RepID=UPI003428E62C
MARRAKFLPPEVDAQIAEAYVRRVPPRRICEDFGISSNALFASLERSGVPANQRAEIKRDILVLHRAGLDLLLIRRLVGRSRTTLRRTLLACGVTDEQIEAVEAAEKARRAEKPPRQLKSDEVERKTKLVDDLTPTYSVRQISDCTGIPKSSVKRYRRLAKEQA